MISLEHKPVLVKEVIKALKIKKNGIYVDATFGSGGYSKAILETAQCKIIAIDRDPKSLKYLNSLDKKFRDKIEFVEGLFSNLKAHLKNLNIKLINGIVFDFGVSSIQLDDGERGFSFKKDGPLDMRMGSSSITAAEIINNSSQNQLETILKFYGEEKNSKKISKEILKKRPLNSSKEFAEIIYSVIGKRKIGKIDPATKSFQAIRIAVNDELNEIKYALRDSIELLVTGGRIVTVSFHSLEDRIVKLFFNNNYDKSKIQNRHFPEVSKDNFLQNITKKPVLPSNNEIKLNIRSRSAKLRIAERTSAIYSQSIKIYKERISA